MNRESSPSIEEFVNEKPLYYRIMPTRRALLVASPDIPNAALPGARLDVHNFERFLLSIEGGAWDQSEITRMFNPTKNSLLEAVRFMSGIDYAFITFSGHGSHHVSKELDDTSLNLTQHESCYVSELNPRNNRHFLIVDACRALVSISEELRKEALFANNAGRPRITRQHSRELFDRTFAAADEGRVVAYSCKVGQAAGESQFGGFFSRHILSESSAWANVTSADEVLSVRLAFERARVQTYSKNAPQMPELQAGRRMRHYPFAIAVNLQVLHG